MVGQKNGKAPLALLRASLTELHILSSPKVSEKLYMYIVVFKYAVSAVLFRHVLSNGQKLVYYVSKALVNVETRYPQVEQTVLVLHIAMKKFHPYF